MALVNVHIDDDDLQLHGLHGLGKEYEDVCIAIRNRGSPMTFEKLHVALIEHESFLKGKEAPSDNSPLTTNYSKKYRQPTNPLSKGSFLSKGDHSKSTMNPASHCGHHHPTFNPSHSKPRPNVVRLFCDKPNHNAKHCY